MISHNLEDIVQQCCLVLLLMTTVLYWGKAFSLKYRSFPPFTSTLMLVCNVLLTVLLVERWVSSGHLPLSNLYESSVFFAWTVTLFHFLLENRIQSEWLGAVTAPSALCIQAFATHGISKDMQQATLLVPALQSNWLMMHVSTMILSYGALFVGSLLAISLLTLDSNTQLTDWRSVTFDNSSSPIYNTDHKNLEYLLFNMRKACLIQQLDSWSYRAISIGFILLTIGILSGAVWANEAWGSFWSWDPKETWALITWLTFASYLHTRMIKEWTGQKRASVALFGFFVVWLCYLGVNLLGKGLHSYGWLK